MPDPTIAPADLVLLVTVPAVPDPALSPNARVDWRTRARAARDLRAAAKLATVSARNTGQGFAPLPAEGDILLDWTIWWPKGRQQDKDDDGVIASLKPARDGIAEALGIDDRRMVTRSVAHHRADGPGLTQCALVVREAGA